MIQLPHSRPALMGILNVTPDSFSDGGAYADACAAIDAGLRMVENGADLIDVGGESTRPGATPVSAEEEIRRTLLVVEGLAALGVTVSIDTRKALVARQALGAGAAVVNDVSGLGDPDMAQVCADAGATVCIMHMQGVPETMQDAPSYGDVVGEVKSFLLERVELAVGAGIARERIWIDPGIGFGKTLSHNVALLRAIPEFVQVGYPVLIGVSRKGFIGRILGGDGNPLPTGDRLEGTLALQALAQRDGARIIRAHDILEARRVIEVTASVYGPAPV